MCVRVCVQEFRAALSAHVGGTTLRVRSVHSGSVPASQPSGSVTETTIAGTTVTRMDAVSLCFSLYFFFAVGIILSFPFLSLLIHLP